MREPVLAPRYDVAVVGGGPAGATAAALLARAGLSVACFERERFPRFHVGESLLPANTPLFARLGVLDTLEAAGFLRKRGAAFLDEAEQRQQILHFRPGPRWAGHAYNVVRSEFDRLLLDHAAKQGAAVFQGATVERVALEPQGVRLEVRAEGGPLRDAEAAFLVDASGRDAFLASRLGRRHPMPDLGKVALFAHYRGAARWPGRQEGYIRIYLFEHGWFWWIPFAGDLTSVGCVLHQRVVRARRSSTEALFREMVAACPGVRAGLRGAEQVTAVHPVANFSYRTEPVVGDRFVALGDAVVFVDPIFSTGVFVAMASAELAVPTIVQLVRDGDFRAARFQPYCERVRRGVAPFFALIESYYDPAFMDVFFARRPPPGLALWSRRAFTAIAVGGAFFEQPAWIRAGLGVMRLAARLVRVRRRRLGLPVDSRLPW